MKNFLVFVLLLLSTLSFSQNNNFRDKWKSIDSLEVIGRVESAQKMVSEIILTSNKDKDFSNFIKGKIYYYKFYQINHENSNQFILEDLNATIGQTSAPYKNVLLSYKAHFLQQFYQQHRWKIRNRKEIDNPDSTSIETWSLETLQDSIRLTYDNSLQDENILISTKIDNIDLLLDPDPLSRKYKPTLYDLLAHRALKYFSDSGNFRPVNSTENYSFDSEKLFAETPIFREISFPKSSFLTSEVKVLQTYQKLEALHSKKEDPEAKVSAQLQRLEYVNTNYKGSEKDKLYLEALQDLSEKYEGRSIHSLILFTLANYFYEQSAETDEDGKLLHPEFRIKAVELAERIIKESPNSLSSQQAVRLLSTIKAISFEAKIPEILVPEKAARMFITYQSIDTVTIKVLKVSSSFSENLPYRKRDSVIYQYSKRNPFQSQVVHLPKAEDYNQHSTEVVISPLETGHYLVYISGDTKNKDFSYSFLQVSNLALSQTNYERYALYQAMDRTTGEAIPNVKLEFLSDKGNVAKTSTADKNGVIKETKSSYNNRSNRIRVSQKGDTLNTNYWLDHYYNYQEEETLMAKSLLYLDRAIYRPGQKVYFKGVLLSYENKKTSTVPGEFVDVYVEDANGEDVAEFRLKTNKYGSFSGEFLLPTTGITGEFRIYTEEDSEETSKFWDKIDNRGEYIENEHYFKVEEYKRPTFEVKFDTIKDSFKLKEMVSLKGQAISFMGAGLNDLPLVYEVKRKELIKYWWYYDYGEETLIKRDTIKTDSKGNFVIDFPALADQKKSDIEDLIYQYSINVTVTDVSGETREGSTTLKIGNKNLLVNISLAENVSTRDTLQPKITATNLNENPVSVKGSLKIHKLNGPDRILTERLWPAPEINIISEEEFKELFPNEPYDSIVKPVNWPKAELVYESQFENDGTFQPSIPVTSEWKSGVYLAEVEVNNGSNSTTSKKTFNVINPEDQYLPDNQALEISFQNKDFKKEIQVELLIQTAYKDLNLFVSAYDNNNRFFYKEITVDGKKLLNIPLQNISSAEVEIQVTGVRNNKAFIEIKTVSLPAESKVLNIVTETFRNKIEPGIEETWSFKIKDEKDALPDAEILASMYDMSLDQFTTQTWNTDPEFSYTRTNFPHFNLSNVGQISYFNNNLSRENRYNRSRNNFDELKDFGFYFSQPNSYSYREYLSRKKQSQKTVVLSGNTKGIITDAAGQPLPGVQVNIKDSSKGTQTNFDGEFAIDTRKGDVLIFSYVGFKSIQHVMGEEKEIFLALEEDSSSLNEVVVVGYEETQEEAIIAVEDSESLPMMLEGKVAGVSIQSSATGASLVQIRGNSSIGNLPMYVVDGKIVSEYNVNAEDIISVEVLEGEKAMALYGALAKNGVVIINTKKGLQDMQNVEARKNLDETAFFFPQLNLNSEGKLQFSFTSPEALSQWKLRLLAHTPDWTTGKYEGFVRTQKELSVQPNPPRFLRESDTIQFQAKVTNLSDKPMVGTAILQLFDAITLEPIDTLLSNLKNIKNFQLQPSNSTAVSFELIIPVDARAVTYRILAKAGDYSDGEENFLPVLTNRMLVKESIPLFVRAGETELYEFSNLRNNTSSTLVNHKFTLEYSSNPAWFAIQSLPYLMEFEHQCSEQTFARLYANSLAAHVLNSQPKIKEVFESWKKGGDLKSDLEKNEELKSLILSETPWVKDALSESQQKNMLAELFDLEKLASEEKEIINKLGRMQNSSGAFPWFSGGRDNYYITRHIVAGFGHLNRLGVDVKGSAIIKNAISYLDVEFLEDERLYRIRNGDMKNFYSSTQNLHYLYARSFFLKDHPFPPKIKSITEKIIRAQKEIWMEQKLFEKGLMILVFTRMQEKETAIKIAASLKESAVKSKEYGMYWKENISSWYWYRAPVETQALIIEAFSEIGNETAAIEEMKIWLLQSKRTSHWPTTKATTDATYALLMQGNDWLQTSDNTIIKLGGKTISAEKIAETGKEAGTGYMKLNWTGPEVNVFLSQIEVENLNTTAGYGGAYWQYFEDLDKIKIHKESPLNIEKELYLNVPGNTGTTLKLIDINTPLKIGDLVTVRLVVRSTADMDYIHLKDMRASGFEPTNVLSKYKYQDGTAYYESTRDAATHFFFDTLRKGTYVLEYTVRANNAGNFSNGITTIESMYAPEFSGHTKGIRVNINKGE